MKSLWRAALHYMLCLFIVVAPLYSLPRESALPAPAQENPAILPLLQKPYLELLQLAPQFRFTGQQYDQARRNLKDAQKGKENDLKEQRKRLESQIKEEQDRLKKVGGSRGMSEDQVAAERHNLHCQIQAWQSQLADVNIRLTNGLPVEYDNLNAKLELMEKWPAAKQEIECRGPVGHGMQP